MRFSLLFGPIALVAAGPTIKSIEFEYYADANCASGTLSAVNISQISKCYDLSSNGLSFHIGGPTTQEQVSQGCVIKGYSDAGCKGSVNVQVAGPSSASKCYVVGVNMGHRNPVKSVILQCKQQ